MFLFCSQVQTQDKSRHKNWMTRRRERNPYKANVRDWATGSWRPERRMPEKSDSERWHEARFDKLRAMQRANELRDEAKRIIALWNQQLAAKEPPLFSPTLHAALISECHWLQVWCRGCDSIAAIDLRVVPRPQSVTIHEIVRRLSCQRCQGQGPLAVPVKLG
jgi:hypothetical protein